ncbi:gamma-crystallin M3-like isoform X2 [Thalassophryne amazonica]|uniref:gamma-crystallin M3-like isoform X2 n=1 Tax=Thalassophryne amazonica TaxID=390379 RepID=UPI00147258D4|nr:gamma-crystallin M3-like isoform X2 [Thalassophryne amazonica]
MGRIIFYEDRNFQGRTHECSSDCADINMYLNRCSSCRVDSGCFMVYDQPNFMGNQIFLKRGEYSDMQRVGSMMGVATMDSIHSCRMVPMHREQFRMRLYERENFGGQMHELMDDCESLQDRYYMSDCQSCNVMDGHWLMFEQPNYRGRMIYIRPGEYRNLRGLGNIMRISSIRRITEIC